MHEFDIYNMDYEMFSLHTIRRKATQTNQKINESKSFSGRLLLKEIALFSSVY